MVRLLRKKKCKTVVPEICQRRQGEWFFWSNITHYFFTFFESLHNTSNKKISLMWSIRGCFLNCKEFKVTRILKFDEGWNFERARSEQNMNVWRKINYFCEFVPFYKLRRVIKYLTNWFIINISIRFNLIAMRNLRFKIPL